MRLGLIFNDAIGICAALAPLSLSRVMASNGESSSSAIACWQCRVDVCDSGSDFGGMFCRVVLIHCAIGFELFVVAVTALI